MIKFNKYNVTNGTQTARVHYSAHIHTGKNMPCVTLYAKSYEDGNKLAEIIPSTFEDESDSRTDYFEKGRARIFEGSPLYAEALKRAKA